MKLLTIHRPEHCDVAVFQICGARETPGGVWLEVVNQ